MEYEGKAKSPYKGLLGSSFLLIAIPVFLFIFIFLIIKKYTKLPNDLKVDFSLMIGFGCGFLFQMTCILSGLFKGTFKVVVNRVKNFFSNLSINFKFAIKYYWEDIKSEGVVFWIYFLIVGSTLGIALVGIIKSYIFYINYK